MRTRLSVHHPAATRTSSSQPGARTSRPPTLENALRQNRWISHAVVLGDSRPYLVALITLDAEEAPAFASAHNLKPDELHRSESMRAELQTAIDTGGGLLERLDRGVAGPSPRP